MHEFKHINYAFLLHSCTLRVMSVTTQTVTDSGSGGIVIDVECHMTKGLPNIIIVGLPNKAVDEAKERLRSALSSSNLQLPRKRITINLAPADLPKDGTGFDLAMAAAILRAGEQTNSQTSQKCLIIGELALNGEVRAVRGIIGKLLAGRSAGYTSFFIPATNLPQAMLVPGLELIPVSSLRDLYLDLSETVRIKRIPSAPEQIKSSLKSSKFDFQDVVGQIRAKRAIEIATAGGHNVLLSGAPGTGKSMLAKATPSILPPATHEEILEITHLHSLASRQYDQIVTERPFRSPHHTASQTSILGGGTNPKPGEISLSHHGVLFFDELPEFGRATLEALRQPLEDKVITVARTRDSITFPANFMFVATCNPCPCGYYGSDKPCVCLPQQIVNYQRKMSGPILDRIDLYVEVDSVKHENLLKDARAEPSEQIRKRVTRARQLQHERYKNARLTNAELTNKDIKRYASLAQEAENLLNQAAERLNISARAYMRTIKVARTIADLEGSENVEKEHIGEALQYRRQTTQELL